MTRDDITRIAREAGLSNDFGRFGYPYLLELERFAALVRADEREAVEDLLTEYDMATSAFAKDFRARGQA
jgi:hypothetical protein